MDGLEILVKPKLEELVRLATRALTEWNRATYTEGPARRALLVSDVEDALASLHVNARAASRLCDLEFHPHTIREYKEEAIAASCPFEVEKPGD